MCLSCGSAAGDALDLSPGAFLDVAAAEILLEHQRHGAVTHQQPGETGKDERSARIRDRTGGADPDRATAEGRQRVECARGERMDPQRGLEAVDVAGWGHESVITISIRSGKELFRGQLSRL